MYVKDCRYGRSRKCRIRIWSIIGICVLGIGMSGVTFRVAAEQSAAKDVIVDLEPEYVEVIEEWKALEQKEEILPQAQCEGVTTMDDGILIALDPGHGGEDEGCSREGVNEKDINLLDILVSIHQNACEEAESEVSGIETFYSVEKSGEDSKRLTQLIHNEVILDTDKKDRGIWEVENLYVIREADMPSCLIETGFLSNAEDRESLLTEEFRDIIVEGIASGIDLYFNPKTMYLTFDDGPSPEYTEKILDVLKGKNIKATFFVIGENVRKNPEVARRIVEEGHTIGIHCNWHDYETLYESVDSYVADFESAYQTVYEVTGVEATLFRFPGGSINAYNKNVYRDIIEEMMNRGFVYFDWNASLEDAVARSTPEELIQNAKESTLGRKKVVLLAHDIVGNTALCLEELIDQFPEYKMEPLTPEVMPIQF